MTLNRSEDDGELYFFEEKLIPPREMTRAPTPLHDKHQISEQMLEDLFKFAQLNYQIGHYDNAKDLLSNYRGIMKSLEADPKHGLFMTMEKVLAVHWGEAACYILTGEKWEQAAYVIALLDDYIEGCVEMTKHMMSWPNPCPFSGK